LFCARTNYCVQPIGPFIMQEASASCQGLRDLDPDPDPDPNFPNLSSQSPTTHYSPSPPVPSISRPSIALELYERFAQTSASVNTIETQDDVAMTDMTSDDSSFARYQPPVTKTLPNDDNSGYKVRKRNNQSPTENTSSNKRTSARINTNTDNDSALPIDRPIDNSSQPDKSVPNLTSIFRYCRRDKPPFIVQVQPIQETDLSNLHPLHISRIISQIFPRGILEIKKNGRNKILAHMSTYEAANRLIEDRSLAERNLKAFAPMHRILRAGIIRDVPQDFTIDMLKDSTVSPIRILEIHRLNRRTKIDNEIKYLPSRTVCIKFSGQLLPEYVYLYNCRYAVSPYIPKARICFNCFRVGHVSKVCKGKPRCIYCGNDKHSPPETCPRAQPPFSCLNCSGDHLATSHLCPDVIRHKMTLTMASANNIPFSEAKKSVYSQSNNSSSPQFADPRFDYWNFPNLTNPRPNPSLPSFESYNKFSLLRDSEYDLSGSFASMVNRKRNQPHDSNNNNRKLPTRNSMLQTSSSNDNILAHRVSGPLPSQQYRSPIFSTSRDHYDLLTFPNGRPSFSHNNNNSGVALSTHPSLIPPLMNFAPPPTSLSDHPNLLKELYYMMNNISTFLRHFSNEDSLPLVTNTQDIAPPTNYPSYTPPPYSSSHFPPLNSETHPTSPRLDLANTRQ